MPQIPSYLAREPLPSSSGLRGGGTGVPVVPQPGAQPMGPGPLEQSLGAIPESLQQTGSIMLQTEELQVRRQRAQDTLDAEVGFQDFRPKLLTLYDTLRQGAYQTLPEDFEKQANDLITEASQTLNPESRALFTAKAKGALVPLHAQAIQERTQRRENTTMMSVMTEVQWLQDQYHRAGNDFERAYHRESLQSMLGSFVEQGLLKGEIGAKILAESDKSLDVEQSQIAVRADPVKAMQNIQALMGGAAPQPGTVWERLSPSLLPGLFDEAVQQLGRKVSFQQAEDQRQRRALQEEQAMIAGGYRAKMADPTLSVPSLIQMVPAINADFQTRRLGEEDHKQLLGQIQTRVEKLKDDVYQDRSNPAVAKETHIRIQTAQTPAQLDQAEQWVKSNTGHLSSATVSQMFTQINQLRDRNDPLNDDHAKEAKRLFLSGAFPGGIIPAMMDKITGEVQARTSLGLDVLNTQLREIYETQGKAAMQRQARDVALNLKDLYFPESATQTSALPPSLPPSFQGIKYYEDGIEVLDALEGMAPEARRRIYTQLKELPRRPAQVGVPKEPGLGKVPGVRPPRQPYAPLESR